MTDTLKLTIELVPQTSWYSNVRSEVSKIEWDIIRRKCYKNANNKCEVCNGVGKRHPVECHEIWEYDENKREQKLVGFIALCPDCHMVKHIGLAQIQGNFDKALKHLMLVNKMTKDEAKDYVIKANIVWNKRSNYKWDLNIKFLEKFKSI